MAGCDGLSGDVLCCVALQTDQGEADAIHAPEHGARGNAVGAGKACLHHDDDKRTNPFAVVLLRLCATTYREVQHSIYP